MILSRISKMLYWSMLICRLCMVQGFGMRITEVLVDGSDEYLELTNTTLSPFIGVLTIQGVKSQPLILPSLDLLPGQSIIVGDTLSFLSPDMSASKLTGLGLSLHDTQPVHIQVLSGDELLDELHIDEGLVRAIDGTMTSFSRVRDGSVWLLESTNHSTGVLGNMMANPGVVYAYHGNEYLPWLLSGLIIDPGQGGQILSCTLPNLLIQEVSLDAQYPPYLELLVVDGFEGELILSGEAVAMSVTLPSQTRSPFTRFLLAPHSSGFLHKDNILIIPDLSLGSGTLTLSTSDGQLIDFLSFDHTSGSWYRKTHECGEHMTILMSPSPGFDHQFLPYVGGSTSSLSCPVPLPSPTPPANSTPSSGSQSSGVVMSGVVRISLLDYNPPGTDTNREQIGVQLLSGDWLSLSGWSLRHGQSVFPLGDGVLYAGSEHVVLGSFQLINTRPLCVQLWFEDQLHDETCYDPAYHPSPYRPLVAEQYDYTQLDFDIRSVVYDPPGADTDTESITIQLLSGWNEVDLSMIRLQVGTKTKKIHGMISSGQILTLTGNFQMPNTNGSCIALWYRDHLYDEYCYTITPRVLNDATPVLELLSDYVVSIVSVVYDPDGKDKDNEAIVLSVDGPQSLDLSQFFLRVNGKTRTLQGILSPGQHTIVGSFQFPNHTASCIELVRAKKVRDRYCYDPAQDRPKTGQLLTGSLPVVRILDLVYDPPGRDTDREQLSLSFQEDTILPQPLSLFVGDKKRLLSDQLHFPAGLSVFSGSFQFPNTKATCVEVWLVDHLLDRYCYDPIQPVISPDGVWDSLRLLWVLPNPTGKDVTKEQVALLRSGQDRQYIDAKVFLRIGKKKYSLSGHWLAPGENIITLSTSLPNTPQCISLVNGEYELDSICYPQAVQGNRYYHHSDGSTVMPELVKALRDRDGDLSKLQLKRSNKKVCLTYAGHRIRCLAVSGSSRNKQQQQLLSLQRAYIRQIRSLYQTKTLHTTTLEQRLHAYEDLASHLKSKGGQPLKVYGTVITPNQLERYVDVVTSQDAHEHLLDVFGRQFFGGEVMDAYYDMLYQAIQ